MERARAAVVASPELRFVVERGRALLFGSGPPGDVQADDALGEDVPADPSPWRPTSPHKRVWQTVLCTLSGFLGGLVIAASAPVWRLWDDIVAPDSCEI